MKSIFDLYERTSQLSSANEGLADLYYDQVLPLRNVSDNGPVHNFGNGIITFRYQPPSGEWWLPSRTYCRMKCRLSKADAQNTQLDATDDVAPNMGMMSNLFSKMEFRMNDRNVSQISEHCAEIDALKTRLRHTGAWMRTIGNSTNWWEVDNDKRKQDVVRSGFKPTEFRIINVNEEVGDLPANPGTPGIQGHFLDYRAAGANSVTVVAAPQSLVFSSPLGNPIPDLTLYLAVGDTVYIENNAAFKVFTITGFATTDNTLLNDTLLVDGPVALVAIGADIITRGGSDVRFGQIALDGKKSQSRRVMEFELLWQPPLSIFDIKHAIPGGSKCELNLTPFSETVYQKNAIESITNNLVHDTDFHFEVNAFEMYVARVKGPVITEKEFYLDLNEVRCQVTQIDNNSKTQHSLDIIPSTTALTVAFQDNAAGNDTRRSLSKFKIKDDKEQQLTNFYIRYGGRQKPQPDFSPEFKFASIPAVGTDNASRDYLTELYMRSLLYSGKFKSSDGETEQEWRDRGIFLHWPWPKTGYDRETRCYVSTQFAKLFENPPKLLLFNHYKRVVVIKMTEGTVVSVLSSNV